LFPASAILLGMRHRRHRGPTLRRDPAVLAVAVDLELRDVALLYGMSVSTLKIHARNGMPHFRHAGKIIVNRAEFEAWRERFRSGRTDALVAEVLEDLPLSAASRRLHTIKKER
jgi:hypothetical protein